MTRLTIEASGTLEAEPVELDEHSGIVAGRTPDPAKASGLAPVPFRGHTIHAPSVSGNHVAVWSDGDGLCLRDLGSRNGTWLRLPPAVTVQLDARHDLNLRLSSPGALVDADAPPPAPDYTDERDFALAIARSVREWLLANAFPAQVSILPAPAGERRELLGGAALRLATGALLTIQPERTVDGSFDQRLMQVSRFVTAQNALFSAEQETRDDGVVLASSSIRRVHRRIVELALQGLPSLVLLGPSGTGKERLSQAYHRSLNRSGPLVPINCSTLTRDRVVADLFGAEPGSYTGAQRVMVGAVQRADGGTLFLDEIGELPLDVQPMLLRFLETGEYQRLGAVGQPRHADVRIVVATNRDLRRMVRDGSFREDLFFRLALEIIEVPPLCERLADLEAYLQRQRLGAVSVLEALQPAALALLREHSWDGNFRELVNLLRRFPREAEPGSLSLAQVQRALEAGALSPVRSTPAPVVASAASDWTSWLRASAEAFAAQAEHGAPTNWGEVSQFVEQYLKPWALAHLAGLQELGSLDEVAVSKVAELLKADRGTVLKQLRRYLEARPSMP